MRELRGQVRKEEAARSSKARGDALAMQASMAFRNLDEAQEEEEGGLTAKQLREWSEAEYHRNRVAEQRGELVRAAKVSELLDDLIGIVAQALGTLPDHLERDLGLGVDEVAKVETRCDGVSNVLRERIEREMLGPAQVTTMPARAEQLGMGV